MRDRITHTLDVPVYHVIMEILYGLRYVKDLIKSQCAINRTEGSLLPDPSGSIVDIL